MPYYEYKCEKCGNITELEFKMTDDRPINIACKEKDCNGIMTRKFGSSVHIPEGWGENDIKFDKSPSGRKHFY